MPQSIPLQNAPTSYVAFGAGRRWASGYVIVLTPGGLVDLVLSRGTAAALATEVGPWTLAAGPTPFYGNERNVLAGFSIRLSPSSPVSPVQFVAGLFEPGEVAIAPAFGSGAAPFSQQLETTDGVTTVNPTTELLIGSNLTLTQPVTGVARVDGAAGGGIEITDGSVDVNPASKLTIGAGLTLSNPNPGEAKIVVATLTQSMVVPVLFDAPDSQSNGYPAFTLNNGFANVRRVVPAFAKTLDGFWYGSVRIPPNYASGGAIILSAVANATAGNVRWIVASAVVANGVTEDTAYTVETAQTITVPNVAKKRFDTTFNLTTTPAAGSTLNVYVERNGANVLDTLAVDCLLWECLFQYTGSV